MNKPYKELKITKVPPLCFKIAKWLQRRNIRGGFRLENLCRSKGLLDVKIRYALGNNVFIDIPIAERPYDFIDIMNYEYESLKYVSTIISWYNQAFCLLDCGADIGLMSARIVSICPNIKQVIAFEPNQNSYNFLKDNMQLLPVPAEAKNMAVSDFTGKAELQFPDFDSSDHAMFIVPSQNGNIDVSTIDDLCLPDLSYILLKVDVEGEEFPVIRGASNTLLKAKHFVILFEAHYKQVQRTMVDPITIISYLQGLRPCKAEVVERIGAKIDLTRPFFDQFPKKIFNICVYSE